MCLAADDLAISYGWVNWGMWSCGLVSTIELTLVNGGTAPCTLLVSTGLKWERRRLHLVDMQWYFLNPSVNSTGLQNSGNDVSVYTASKAYYQLQHVSSAPRKPRISNKRGREICEKHVGRGYNNLWSKPVLPPNPKHRKWLLYLRTNQWEICPSALRGKENCCTYLSEGW